MRRQNRRKQLRFSQRLNRRLLQQSLRLRLPLAPVRGLDRVLRLHRLQCPALVLYLCRVRGPFLLVILFPCLNQVWLPDRHQAITQQSLLNRKG